MRSDEVAVAFTAGPGVDLDGPVFFCAGDGAVLTASPLDASNPPFSVNWGHGPLGTSVNVADSGTYTATVTDGSGCASTASLTVTAGPGLLRPSRGDVDRIYRWFGKAAAVAALRKAQRAAPGALKVVWSGLPIKMSARIISPLFRMCVLLLGQRPL